VKINFEAHDTWILLAILYASRDGSYAGLSSIIAAADFINHAIPTLGELDGALDRLHRADWIEIRGLEFRPSAQALELLSSRSAGRRYVHKDFEVVRKRLGGPVWSSQSPRPLPPEQPRIAGLTEEAVANSYAEYRKNI
jgi:hypothetical protein